MHVSNHEEDTPASALKHKAWSLAFAERSKYLTEWKAFLEDPESILASDYVNDSEIESKENSKDKPKLYSIAFDEDWKKQIQGVDEVVTRQKVTKEVRKQAQRCKCLCDKCANECHWLCRSCPMREMTKEEKDEQISMINFDITVLRAQKRGNVITNEKLRKKIEWLQKRVSQERALNDDIAYKLFEYENHRKLINFGYKMMFGELTDKKYKLENQVQGLKNQVNFLQTKVQSLQEQVQSSQKEVPKAKVPKNKTDKK